MESSTILDGIRLLLGLGLVVAGRNIFWLVIATMGFLFGLEVAQLLLPDQSIWLTLVIGVILGLGGAVLAIIFERLAFILAGFFAGFLLVIICAANTGMGQMPAVLPYLAGGLGALLAGLLTDWAIIVLSAAVGAAVLVSVLGFQPVISSVIFLVLTVIGVAVQRQLLVRQRTP